MRSVAGTLLGLVLLVAQAAWPAPVAPAPEDASAAAVVRPGENLVTDGIPDLPAALAARQARYQEVRAAYFQDWLPGAEGMLIITRFADTAQVHKVPFAGGRREQLTFFPDRVAFARACPRKGCGYFVFGKDRGGDEFFQLYRQPLAGGEAVLLSDGRSKNEAPLWDRAGKQIAYASTRRNGKDFDLYLQDPEQPGSARLLAELEGLWLPLDFSPDGKTLLVRQEISISERHLWRLDVASGQKSPLSPPDEKGVAYGGARFSPDGKRIYLVSDRGHEFLRLLVQDAAPAAAFEPRPVTAALGWDVEAFDLSADGKTLALVVNQAGFSELRLLAAATGKALPAPELPRGVLSGLRFQRDGARLALSLTGSRLPGDVFAHAPKARALERWTFSELAGLSPEELIEPQLVDFPTFDDDGPAKRRVPALLYLPPAGRFQPPYPVVISIHGGPESQARPWYQSLMNYRIAELGLAVVSPNVRGSSGYGKTYLALDDGKAREDSVRDIGALLDWLPSRPELDPKRVAVSGGSYGGYMALASLTMYADRLKAGVSYVGISSFVTFLENTQPYRQDLRRVEYGDEREPGMRMFLEMISPLSNAERIRAPLLVLQGQNDPRVPAAEAAQIVAKVRGRGGEVWYLLARDEGHGFVKKTNVDFANLVTTRFLQRHLLGQ
ncbi:MAG TPA: alpha/beta fold hydrolase [Myxococcota bacterium]|nr:alpha/beta fold hydrolase [Myxococcota bacterium]HRY94178.1 alpha/beta fold hydrolase [Myxococcota bacterium]HSA20502.1 alpha/beta fold hydrolase [Myxococcota bacterium]